MAAQAIETQKKHDSQEEYFVNDQGVVVYLKIFRILLQMRCLFSWF